MISGSFGTRSFGQCEDGEEQDLSRNFYPWNERIACINSPLAELTANPAFHHVVGLVCT
jgi:hypothetical protein